MIYDSVFARLFAGMEMRVVEPALTSHKRFKGQTGHVVSMKRDSIVPRGFAGRSYMFALAFGEGRSQTIAYFDAHEIEPVEESCQA